MKKSKFAIVIALGLVLCLLCGVTTTFHGSAVLEPNRVTLSGGAVSTKSATVRTSASKPLSQEMTALLSVKMKLLISEVLCRQEREDIFVPKFLTRAMPNRMFRFS